MSRQILCFFFPSHRIKCLFSFASTSRLTRIAFISTYILFGRFYLRPISSHISFAFFFVRARRNLISYRARSFPFLHVFCSLFVPFGSLRLLSCNVIPRTHTAPARSNNLAPFEKCCLYFALLVNS